MNLEEIAAKQLVDIEIDIETEDIFDYKKTVNDSKKLIKVLEEESLAGDLEFVKKLDFEENEWIFWNGITGTSEVMDFSFVEDSFAFVKHVDVTVLTNVLKCWVLHRLTTDELTPTSVDTYLKHITEALIKTNGFCIGGADHYCEFIKSLNLSDGSKRQKIISVLNFLSFYDELDSEYEYTPQLFRLLNNLKVTSKSRTIPSGLHILKFSNILEHFFNNVEKSSEKYIRFLPLLLWWKITTVIPLRPFEFCAIKPDCLDYEGEEEKRKCYLLLPRLKVSKKKKKYLNKKQLVSKICIPKDIESLINEYNEAIKGFNHDNRKTLISRLVYDKTNSVSSHNLKRDNVAFLTPDLSSLIKAFYSEIIKNVYGLTSTHLPPIGRKSKKKKENNKYDLIRVRSIDTRHIAFINMLAQGWSKPEIARFGGHHILETQESYQNHREYWIEEETQKMMEKFRLGVKISPTIKDEDYEDLEQNDGYLLSMRLDAAFKRKFILRPPTTQIKRKVKIGFCTDPLQACKGHCVHCDYWRISLEEFEEKRNEILMFIKESDEHIHELFAFLKDLQRFVFEGELNNEIAERIISSQKQIDDEIFKRAKLLYNIEKSNIGGVINGK